MLQSVCPSFLLGDLDSAVRAGVIEVAGERVRFTHPLLAATHYASAGPRGAASCTGCSQRSSRMRSSGPIIWRAVPRRPIVRSRSGSSSPRGCRAARRAPETGAELLEQASRLTPLDAVEARGLECRGCRAAFRQRATSGAHGPARRCAARASARSYPCACTRAARGGSERTTIPRMVACWRRRFTMSEITTGCAPKSKPSSRTVGESWGVSSGARPCPVGNRTRRTRRTILDSSRRPSPGCGRDVLTGGAVQLDVYAEGSSSRTPPGPDEVPAAIRRQPCPTVLVG